MYHFVRNYKELFDVHITTRTVLTFCGHWYVYDVFTYVPVTAVSRGVEPSTSARVAPDVPHHEAASTRYNPSVEETKLSTLRTPRANRGQTPRPQVWISHTLIETDFGSRRRKTG